MFSLNTGNTRSGIYLHFNVFTVSFAQAEN